jgi:hypothetical protein
MVLQNLNLDKSDGLREKDHELGKIVVRAHKGVIAWNTRQCSE